MKIRFWAVLTSLALLGVALSAAAHPCKHHDDKEDPHCQDAPGGNANSESNDKVYAVKVVFDQDIYDSETSDNVMSDGSGPYIDDVNVTANVPEEGTPPGQFLMWQGGWKNPSSTLFLDFGEAEDCAVPEVIADGCVKDSQDHSVPCPIPLGARYPSNDQCSGFKPVTLVFRHTVDENGAADQFILDMTPGVPYDGEAYGAEMRFDAESNSKSWRLVFKQGCDPGETEGDFLKIERYDMAPAGNDPLDDYWYISTHDLDGSIVTTTKTACLTRDGKGNTPIPNGLFEMQFGYTICILKNPGTADYSCVYE
jgi:hypothetical protein